MNTRVARLLADYFRRTFGVWALIVLVELLQATVFWGMQVNRVPLLGATVSGLLYYAAINSPQAVVRTLPLSRGDVALFRWWAAVGAPGLIVVACTLIAAVTNAQHKWPEPSWAGIGLTAGFSLSVLGWFTLLPLPTLGPGERSRPWFALVWSSLILAAIYGLPYGGQQPDGAPHGGSLALMAVMGGGIGAGLWTLVRAIAGKQGIHEWSSSRWGRHGRRTRDVEVYNADVLAERFGALPWHRRAFAGMRAGWPLLVIEVARSAAYLSMAGFLALSAVHLYATPWFLSTFGPTLISLFASAIAVAGSFLTRRWLSMTRPLRLLPISDRRLALVFYLILTTPGVVTCLAMMIVRQLFPSWGLEIPGYVLVLFMLLPVAAMPWQQRQAGAAASAVQQWSPVMQQAAFALWAGPVCAVAIPHIPPAWLAGSLAFMGVCASLLGYAALLIGIRSLQGLEVPSRRPLLWT